MFKGFTCEELSQCFNSNKYRIAEYKKDQIIHLQNEICRSMDIILQGRISVRKIDQNGNVLIINTFSERDIIGGNILFSLKNKYPMTITAESDTVLLHLSKELILSFCEKNKNFTIKLLQIVSDKTRILTDKINHISMNSIRDQLIIFLRHEYYKQKSDIVKLSITKKELAERLGIQRTSLSRELNKMRKDGLLEYDLRTFTLKKPIKLLFENYDE